MQTNWIGRSEGAEIDFAVEADDVEPIRVFTTRPDTVFGATFMVLAPEHPLVPVLTTDERRGEVEAYVAAARRETEIERMSAEREKTGVFIGAYAINPMTERADPGLDRRLRPARLRHRRDHGRPRPRRARLRLRAEVRPADPLRGACRRAARLPEGEAFVAHTADEVLVDSGEFTGMPASRGDRRRSPQAAGRAWAAAGRR